jgi:hypothetical protein
MGLDFAVGVADVVPETVGEVVPGTGSETPNGCAWLLVMVVGPHPLTAKATPASNATKTTGLIMVTVVLLLSLGYE